MQSFARLRKLGSLAVASVAFGAMFFTPAAEAATPPPGGPIMCQLCGTGGVPVYKLDTRPDLFLSTMYQQDASGNSIQAAAPGQVVVYPMTIGNQGLSLLQLQGPSNVSVWWMGDTSGLNNPGWVFQSYTADSGFVCHQPGDDYTGEQVRCDGGTIPAGQVAHITITMRAPTTAGVHKIGVDIDPLNAIPETNESNNNPCCLSLTI